MAKQMGDYTTYMGMSLPVGLVIRLAVVAEKEHITQKDACRVALKKYVEDMEKLYHIIPA